MMNTSFLRRMQTYFFAFMGLTVGILGYSAPAHSTFISPPRIMIDANKSTGEMVIMNRNKETMIYTFSWQDRALGPDGAIYEDENARAQPNYMPASPHVIFSPRQAIIGPGEAQRIRFFVKRTKDMKEGEYRSHIVVAPKPKEKDKAQVIAEGGTKAKAGGVIPIMSRAGIPVMVRHGKTVVDMEPKSITFEKIGDRTLMNFDFINNSTRTVYAKPVLTCLMPGADKPITKELLAMRLYHEAQTLKRQVYIPEDFDVDACTSLTVGLKAHLDFEYAKTPFYETTIR